MILAVFSLNERPVGDSFSIERATAAAAYNVNHAIRRAALISVHMATDHDIHILLGEERNPIDLHPTLAGVPAAVPKIRIRRTVKTYNPEGGLLGFRAA